MEMVTKVYHKGGNRVKRNNDLDGSYGTGRDRENLYRAAPLALGPLRARRRAQNGALSQRRSSP